jgi:hypothetical protein
MSFAHIRLVKRDQTTESVTYLAETRDFAANGEWEAVAKVELDTHSDHFSFAQLGPWANERVVPPHLYELAERELAEKLSGDFAGHAYGAWTSKILKKIRNIQSSGQFPDEA